MRLEKQIDLQKKEMELLKRRMSASEKFNEITENDFKSRI